MPATAWYDAESDLDDLVREIAADGGGGPVRKKLVIVGDGSCGKTCLLVVLSRDEFPKVVPCCWGHDKNPANR